MAADHPSSLRAARLAHDLSQEALAYRAGLCAKTVGLLERGATPQLRTARALARALDEELTVLFPDNEDEAAWRSARVTTSAEAGPIRGTG